MLIDAWFTARKHELPLNERAVLLALADFHNDRKPDTEAQCYPSVSSLGAAAGGLSRRAVQRALASLCRRGIVRRFKRTGTSNEYVLMVPRWKYPERKGPSQGVRL